MRELTEKVVLPGVRRSLNNHNGQNRTETNQVKDMKKRAGKGAENRIRKRAASLLLCLMLTLLLTVGATATCLAAQEGEQTVLPGENGEELVITVEGSEEAESITDIEEDSVPLAESAGAARSADGMHVIWASVFLAGTIVYAAYFSRKQKKLFLLKRNVAEAEYALQQAERKERDTWDRA